MENEHNHNDQISREMVLNFDNQNDQISREMVMSFDNQNHQLCGPDGGFTAAGRDSLLFQVLLFKYTRVEEHPCNIFAFNHDQNSNQIPTNPS